MIYLICGLVYILFVILCLSMGVAAGKGDEKLGYK